MATINETDEITEQPPVKKQKLDVEDDAQVKEPITEKVTEKSDASAEAVESAPKPSKLQQDIIDQIEYYFSDSNLFRDKFLQTEITKKDGWVALATLITFKRLAALSTDPNVIVEALDKSDSGLLEIHEDRESIRRHPERPLPERNEEVRQEIQQRTAYVKGFPKEMEMPEMIEFFKDYPKVSHVVIRKYVDKPTKTYKSKGSVFVTFSTRDQCAAFLSEDVKYKDAELIAKWQTDYHASKKTERQEKQKEKNAKLNPEINLPKGSVLHITDIKPDVTRDKIKAKIEAMEYDVAFVDYTNGDAAAYVRLNKENAAKELFAKLDNSKIQLEENDVPVIVLEGETEEKYLAECVEKIKQRRRQDNNYKKKHHNKHRSRD